MSKSKHDFLPVAQDYSESDEASETGYMLEHDFTKTKSQSQRILTSPIPWICTTLGLSLYVIISAVLSRPANQLWSATDAVFTRPLIVDSRRTFTSGLDYNNDNHSLQHTLSEGLKYIGQPSPELDAAWDIIAGTQEVFLTKEEAVASGVEDTYVSPLTGLPVVEIEGLHHLHCLNYVRKSIDLEHYPDISEQETWRIHVEHCINSIREFIMCKADMTPIVLVPPERAGVPVPVPEFRTKHVCRNFDQLNSFIRKERTANLGDEESREIARRIRKVTGTKY